MRGTEKVEVEIEVEVEVEGWKGGRMGEGGGTRNTKHTIAYSKLRYMTHTEYELTVKMTTYKASEQLEAGGWRKVSSSIPQWT